MHLSFLERHHPAPDPNLPVHIMIHGRGDSPQNFIHLSDGVNTPRRELALYGTQELDFGFDRGWQWFESSASEGDSPGLCQGINQATSLIAEDLRTLNEIEQKPTRRFVISGFSQGGMLCYALALQYPELVAHAIPIAGLLPAPCRPAMQAGPGTASPAQQGQVRHFDPNLAPRIDAFHGQADPLVCPKRANELIEHLRSISYPVSFKQYPGVEHTVSQDMLGDYEKTLESALKSA